VLESRYFLLKRREKIHKWACHTALRKTKITLRHTHVYIYIRRKKCHELKFLSIIKGRVSVYLCVGVKVPIRSSSTIIIIIISVSSIYNPNPDPFSIMSCPIFYSFMQKNQRPDIGRTPGTPAMMKKSTERWILLDFEASFLIERIGLNVRRLMDR